MMYEMSAVRKRLNNSDKRESKKERVYVQLSKEEREWLEENAHGKHDPKRGIVRDKQVCRNRTGLEIHIQGNLGEYAGDQYLGIPFDTRLFLHGDGGIDRIYRGWSLQYKFINRVDGDLYFNNLSEVICDILIMTTHGKKGSICIVGWIDKDTFIEKYVITDYGYGDRVAIEQVNLFDMENLKYIPEKSECMTT